MIDKNTVLKLVEEKLGERLFLIDISISKNNVINIFVDGFDGITIEKCIEISRNVEHNLDREEEDFELQVSSTLVTESFKVKEQYYKHKSRDIEIVTSKDILFKGVLEEVTDEDILLVVSGREKVEGHKKRQLIVKLLMFVILQVVDMVGQSLLECFYQNL